MTGPGKFDFGRDVPGYLTGSIAIRDETPEEIMHRLSEERLDNAAKRHFARLQFYAFLILTVVTFLICGLVLLTVIAAPPVAIEVRGPW